MYLRYKESLENRACWLQGGHSVGKNKNCHCLKRLKRYEQFSWILNYLLSCIVLTGDDKYAFNHSQATGNIILTRKRNISTSLVLSASEKNRPTMGPNLFQQI